LFPAANRGANHSVCDDCVRSMARRAVELRKAGHTLRQIADELDYSSVTSVTNLMKTVIKIDTRMGRPSRLQRGEVQKS